MVVLCYIPFNMTVTNMVSAQRIPSTCLAIFRGANNIQDLYEEIDAPILERPGTPVKPSSGICVKA